jgi:hypothetical protein
MSHWLVVLSDGTTYDALETASVVEVPDDFDHEDFEDFLEDAPLIASGKTVTDLIREALGYK